VLFFRLHLADGVPLTHPYNSGSWVEIVEVGMVGSGIIKTGAVLSWEGIQYYGTSGFKVCLCCECVRACVCML